LGYVTTFPAARNASTCERESGVRIIWRRSSPIVSTQAPQVGSLRILHGRISPLPMWSERIPQSRARRTRAQPLRDGTDGKAVAREREPSVRSGCSGRVEDWRADLRLRRVIHRFRGGPQSGCHHHVSSPRRIERSVRVSRTTLTCSLRAMVYGTYATEVTFRRSRRNR
jgi:hypothetical protein